MGAEHNTIQWLTLLSGVAFGLIMAGIAMAGYIQKLHNDMKKELSGHIDRVGEKLDVLHSRVTSAETKIAFLQGIAVGEGHTVPNTPASAKG